MKIDHDRLRAAILGQLAADLDLQTRAAHIARDEAISDESKAENKYDTRAQEAAYLAQGQARQAAEVHDSIGAYHGLQLPVTSPVITVGHLVELTAAERIVYYFLGPRAGGLEIELDGQHVTIVTPASPLGRQLLGRRTGDTVTLPGRVRPLPHTITAFA